MQWSVEWLYWAIAGTLAVCSLVLACWALFWDRSRGKRRCPSCWYDLSGSQGFAGDKDKAPALPRCTECGKKPRSERSLHRTRRHWRWLPAAGLLLIAADSVRRIPDPDSEGWTRFVPTTVMILVPPMTREEFIESAGVPDKTKRTLTNAFLARLQKHDLADWQTSLWLRQLKRWEGSFPPIDAADNVTRSGFPLDEPPEPREVMVIDTRPFIDLVRRSRPWVDHSGEHFDSPTREPPEWNPTGWEQVTTDEGIQAVLDIVSNTIASWSWAANGGREGSIFSLGSVVVVMNTEDRFPRIRELLARLLTAPSGADHVDDPATIEHDRATLARLNTVRFHHDGGTIMVGKALETVGKLAGFPVTAEDNPASLSEGGPLYLAHMDLPQGDWSLRDVLDKVCEYLAVEGFVYSTDYTLDVDADGVCLRDVVWLRAMRVFDVSDILSSVREHLPPPRDMSTLRNLISMKVLPESWAENGGVHLLQPLGSRLLVTTDTRKEMVIFADFLARLRRDPSPLMQPL